jgi:nucleoside-diphosphate-sugar epimerase
VISICSTDNQTCNSFSFVLVQNIGQASLTPDFKIKRDIQLENLRKSYSNRKVLVTGGASFIGSHLVESLVGDGAVVTVADDLSSGRIDNLASCMEEIDFVQCDLRNTEAAEGVVQGQQTVFHLANVHGGRGFIETHPGEIVQNLLIDGNVFRACWKSAVENVCYASSACVYPTFMQGRNLDRQARFLSEEMADPFVEGGAAADGVYGWCKLMGEMALASYHKQFGLRGVSCRLFTVYGPRENESHAIVAFMARALTRQDPFVIWGSGQQDRNFTYVSDAVEGLKRAASRIFDGSAINIGTDEITSVRSAAELICELEGYRPSQFFCDTTKPEGVFARAASVRKQMEVLGWRPSVSFKDGIRYTFAHYRASNTVAEIEAGLQERLFAR